VRECSPDTQLYIMGPHPTMRPRELLETTGAHAAIMGEPEATIVELCEDGKDLSSVNGVAYFNKNEFVQTDSREPADLSTFPVPAFHLLPMKKYFYEIMGSRFTLLETSRGCPYQCIFCAEDLMYGSKYRMKPIGSITKELDICVKKFGVRNVYFIDLEFTLDKSFVSEICSMLVQKDYRLAWACQTRTDSVDLKLLKMMRQAGCRIIHYGLESGSPEVLESTLKRISLDSMRQGIRWAKEAGMEVVCFTMMGLPGETIDDMIRTIEFAKEVNPDYISFHVATPYPGTKFHESVKHEVKGLFPPAYEGNYTEEVLKRVTRKAFREFYVRPRYIVKRIRQGPRLLLNQLRLLLRFLG
jgi:anaerobic magnesium-protoporphyrin IX monomethyl ester cyclase